LLNEQWITKEIRGIGVQKLPEHNENENIIDQNLWSIAKAVLRGKLVQAPRTHKKETQNWQMEGNNNE
jgi:hypothetical protein